MRYISLYGLVAILGVIGQRKTIHTYKHKRKKTQKKNPEGFRLWSMQNNVYTNRYRLRYVREDACASSHMQGFLEKKRENNYKTNSTFLRTINTWKYEIIYKIWKKY